MLDGQRALRARILMSRWLISWPAGTTIHTGIRYNRASTNTSNSFRAAAKVAPTKEHRAVGVKLRKVFGGIILTILWVCGFLFIRPTLVFDFGAGITVNLKFAVAVIGLLIIILYHIFYRSSTEITKLSLTCSLTIAWLAVVFFYPFQPNQGTEAAYVAGKIYDGAVGFFTLLSGLAVCVLWVRFFADDIKIEE